MIIQLNDRDVHLLPEGAVWLPQQKILCAADLHFEKGSFFSHFATFLPPYDSDETLMRLEKLVADYVPDIFIAAGDSFHDKNAPDRLSENIKARLNTLIDKVGTWHWLTGNHDPFAASELKGQSADEHTADEIIFRHRTAGRDEAEISGHYHPKVRLSIRNQFLSAPCFVLHKQRLFLPSFGQYTGGLDINSMAFQAIVPPDEREFFPIKDGRVFAL